MESDLERSVRILEDALAVSGRGLIKLNTSKSIRGHRSLRVEKPDLDGSSVITNASFLQDKTATGSVIRAVEPWKSAIDSLFIEFLEILQVHANEQDVLGVVSDLARCCSDAKNVVDELKSKVAVPLSSDDKWLELERNTWRLLYILYQDRLAAQSNNEHVPQYFGPSEKMCIINLFKRENLIREVQLVIDWLEYSAAEQDDELLHFSDHTVGWENTLHQLKSKDTIVFASLCEIVNKLDPDAPHYQKLPLHDLDMADESKLLQKLFREIRCGKLHKAQQLCVQCGHAWRAAQLEGWKLFHDPNLEPTTLFEEDDKMDSSFMEIDQNNTEPGLTACKPTEGNLHRDIWKSTCLKYCDQTNLHKYEKASLAAYCGYLKPLLTVCKIWEDALWAYMRVMVDVRVESEIRDYVSRHYEALPGFYWDQKMSLNQVFSNIEASRDPAIQKEAQDMHHVIQKHIILDEIPVLLQKVKEWLDHGDTTAHFKRFAAHLVLFLEQIGLASRQDVDVIVEVYVKQLTEMKETPSVTFYASKLNPQNQVHICASYFESITDNEAQKEALLYAEENGLNTMDITKQIVENVRNRPHDVDEVRDLQARMTVSDKFKIDVIDWLLFYEAQAVEALYQTNALIFTFLTLGKLDAAQLAFNKIPLNAVEMIVSEGEPSAEVGQIIKEHLSYKAYLDAQEAFNIWFEQFNSKPVPPEDIPENANFTEKVAHQHLVSQYNAETERWKLRTAHHAKNARTVLYNVLLFPDGGWLTGAKDAEFLRSICIPQVVLLLYSVLFESGKYSECVQLADILAAEKYGLYAVYSKEKLQEILVKLCDSSVALLNQNKDPLGSDE